MKLLFRYTLLSILGVLLSVQSAHAGRFSFSKKDPTYDVTTKIGLATGDTTGAFSVTVVNKETKQFTNVLNIYKADSSTGVCGTDVVFTETHIIQPSSTFEKNTPLSSLTPNTTYCFDYDQWLGEKFTTDNGSTLATATPPKDSSYRLLAPFPGLAVLLDPSQCGAVSAGKICSINDLLNFIFKILIGVTAVSLVFRLIWDGYRIMTTDVPFIKVNAKSDFFTALGGLLLALSAYIILNTINPKLVSNDISIQGVGVGVIVQPLSEAHQYRLAQTQDTPGAKKFARTPYYDQIKSIVAATAPTVPHCLLQVAIQRESSGGGQGVQLIGHDEDVNSDGIRSRKDFIASGKKSDGTTFSGASITDAGFKNTDHTNPYTTKKAPNPSASDLGLDWRFTHSVGMFGTTFGPKAGLVSDAKKIYNGSTDLDITIAAKNMENFYDKCNHDIKGTWTSYGAWACTLTKPNSFLDKEVPIRIDLYNQCVLQDK
jgi:hypothetical protein